MDNNLEQILNNFNDKTVIVNQCGFVESIHSINEFKYFIEYDVLNIIDENSGNYIKINLNQIYKIENEKDKVIFYLDNDISVILSIKR